MYDALTHGTRLSRGGGTARSCFRVHKTLSDSGTHGCRRVVLGALSKPVGTQPLLEWLRS